MTREVPEGWKIQETVAMAAKVYALKMGNDSGDENFVNKAKGVTLNSETSDLVHFGSMKELMIKNLRKEEWEPFHIQRMKMKRGDNILDGRHSVIETKRLKPVMDKGFFDEEGNITPYGSTSEQIENKYPF